MTDADASDLADRVAAGELRLHELAAHADPDTAAAARRLAVERATGADLDAVDAYGFDAAAAESNIENMVGAVQVPLGVAGPVPVSGSAAAGEYHLPLATTEGGLVAGINRGCSALSAAGGVTARIVDSGMTRAPVFSVDDVAAAQALVEWARANVDALRAAAESTTRFGELRRVDPYVVGDSVFLRFVYDTKDAMGMNMATIATEAAAEVVEAETEATLVSLSGNLCADKKPAAVNAVEGRGHTVVADATLPAGVVADRFGADPAAVAEVNARKNFHGSAKAGSLGFNAHVANVVGAAFLATGQDEAQVVEGSNAVTTAAVRDGDLYVSVSLASLPVGTVGGGTDLPAQSAALDVVGVAGGGYPPGSHADELAEVIAAGALAAELNLLGALAANHLAEAHADLGR